MTKLHLAPPGTLATLSLQISILGAADVSQAG